MTDATPPGNGSQAPHFAVIGQYIKDLSFENPDAIKFLRGPGKNPNLHVNFNIAASGIGEDAFEVNLTFDVEAKCDEGILYKIELVYAGAFVLRNLPEQSIQPVLHVDCAALLFPFARRLIADLTREAGYPPLALDPINFAAVYNQKVAESQRNAAAS